MGDGVQDRQRQSYCWWLMSVMFSATQDTSNLRDITADLADELDLPELVMDPQISIDQLLQRYPKLAPRLENLLPGEPEGDPPPPDLERLMLFGKLLLNVFGPNTQSSVVSATQYSQWLQDVGHFERATGHAPGELRTGQASPGEEAGEEGDSAAGTGQGRPGQGDTQTSDDSGNKPGSEPGSGGYGEDASPTGTGMGRAMSEEELSAGLQAMEKDLVQRMAIREILKDNRLAKQLKPSMALVEQLLRDKSNLSGEALRNAKDLIRRFVDEVAEVLKTEVANASVGKIDFSVPPKRVFRNLDLKRTLWKNLPNWNPEEQVLYVDRLYYRHTSKLKTPSRMIVSVDQSGSMVDAMVNCTILASIFAGLPNVATNLVAYDTQAVDLSPWVNDPFEVLLRTNLGGGTKGLVAMDMVEPMIEAPRHTALVWISDFYDWDNEALFNRFKALKEAGVKIIPVGSVTSSGYYSVDGWFKQRFKALGRPILSGNIKKLIVELKNFLA